MVIGSLDIFPRSTEISNINNLTGYPLSVRGGGTGLTSLTNNGVLIGQGTSPITTVLLNSGQVLIGSTGNVPVANTLTAGPGITIVNVPGSITISSSVNALTIAADAGSAMPIGGTLSIVGTGIISTTGAGNTITIQSNGSGLPWMDVTAASSTTMVNNTGYFSDSASMVTLTLPGSSVIGDVIRVGGYGSGGWTIAQQAGQKIIYGSQSTTTGVAGSLQSSDPNDAVELAYVKANTFLVLSSVGNLIRT